MHSIPAVQAAEPQWEYRNSRQSSNQAPPAAIAACDSGGVAAGTMGVPGHENA